MRTEALCFWLTVLLLTKFSFSSSLERTSSTGNDRDRFLFIPQPTTLVQFGYSRDNTYLPLCILDAYQGCSHSTLPRRGLSLDLNIINNHTFPFLFCVPYLDILCALWSTGNTSHLSGLLWAGAVAIHLPRAIYAHQFVTGLEAWLLTIQPFSWPSGLSLAVGVTSHLDLLCHSVFLHQRPIFSQCGTLNILDPTRVLRAASRLIMAHHDHFESHRG